MYTEDARWYRARIIRYVSGEFHKVSTLIEQCLSFLPFHFKENVCEVFYIDYGNMEELHVEFIHEILPEFSRMPARAIACTISQVKLDDCLFLLDENYFLVHFSRFYRLQVKKVGRNVRHSLLLRVALTNVFKRRSSNQRIYDGQCILFV